MLHQSLSMQNLYARMVIMNWEKSEFDGYNCLNSKESVPMVNQAHRISKLAFSMQEW